MTKAFSASQSQTHRIQNRPKTWLATDPFVDWLAFEMNHLRNVFVPGFLQPSESLVDISEAQADKGGIERGVGRRAEEGIARVYRLEMPPQLLQYPPRLFGAPRHRDGMTHPASQRLGAEELLGELEAAYRLLKLSHFY